MQKYLFRSKWITCQIVIGTRKLANSNYYFLRKGKEIFSRSLYGAKCFLETFLCSLQPLSSYMDSCMIQQTRAGEGTPVSYHIRCVALRVLKKCVRPLTFAQALPLPAFPPTQISTLISSFISPNKFLSLLWAGYTIRRYPDCTQELNQILGPFCFVQTAESSQDFKIV